MLYSEPRPSTAQLYTSTFTVWTAVQRIAALHHQEHLGALVKPGSRGRRAPSMCILVAVSMLSATHASHSAAPSPEVVQHHHALAQGYLDAIAQYSKELEVCRHFRFRPALIK